MAYEWFAKAMTEFEKSLEICYPDNQDVILRWNSCARFLSNHEGFRPDAPQVAGVLMDAYETPH